MKKFLCAVLALAALAALSACNLIVRVTPVRVRGEKLSASQAEALMQSFEGLRASSAPQEGSWYNFRYSYTCERKIYAAGDRVFYVTVRLTANGKAYAATGGVPDKYSINVNSQIDRYDDTASVYGHLLETLKGKALFVNGGRFFDADVKIDRDGVKSKESRRYATGYTEDFYEKAVLGEFGFSRIDELFSAVTTDGAAFISYFLERGGDVYKNAETLYGKSIVIEETPETEESSVRRVKQTTRTAETYFDAGGLYFDAFSYYENVFTRAYADGERIVWQDEHAHFYLKRTLTGATVTEPLNKDVYR